MTKGSPGLLKSTFWYGAGNLVVRLINFALLPLYSNLISVDQFGVYSLLMSVYSVAAVLYNIGMPSSLTNFYLKESDQRRRKVIFSSVINTVGILGLFLTLTAIISSRFLANGILGEEKFQLLIQLVFIALFVDTVSMFILQLYKTLEQSKRVVIFMFLGAILNLAMNVWLVYGLRMDIYGIIISQLFSSGLVLILMLPDTKNYYVFAIENEILKKILLFSIPLFLSGLFAAGIDVADRFILNFLLGKKQVGEYSFAYRIALITNIFVISFRTAWMPYAINRWKENNYKEIFGKTFLKLLAAGVFILIAVSFFAEDLFKLKILGTYLFNPEYRNGLVILPFVVLGYIFSSLAAFYSVYPFVSNKSYHFLISDGIGLIINLVLNFILIPLIGLLGAGIATCLSFMIMSFYLYLISKNKIKIDYLIKENFVIALVGSCFTITGLIVNNFWLQINLLILFLLITQYAVKLSLPKLFSFSK